MIEAQDQLNKLTVSDWPNQPKEKRSEIHRLLSEKAFPEIYREKVIVVTQSDLNRVLGLSSGR